MSSMIFKIDKENPFWRTYDNGNLNEATFRLTVKHLEEVAGFRAKDGDVLDLNEILRTFCIVPDISCYGWFVLRNRYAEDLEPFINLIHVDDEKIIFEVTDLRRD